MTYEEARNRLLKSKMPYDKAQREYDALCLSALNKQIPKKPLLNVHCPSCGSLCIGRKGYRHNYCKNCGQRIDWSEEE